MKQNLRLLIVLLFPFMGCITQQQIQALDKDKRQLYPIEIYGKWGISNDVGDIVVPPQFDTVQFFHSGLAVARTNNKYGYINKQGDWHIKPKYIKAEDFQDDHADVSSKNNFYIINRKGRKTNHYLSHSPTCGLTTIELYVLEQFIVQKNNKYEIPFKYWLVSDSTHLKQVIDTTHLKMDSVFIFSYDRILCKKRNKYGFYKFMNPEEKIFQVKNIENYKPIDLSYKHNQVAFIYDEVIYIKSNPNAVHHAAVRIGNKWGAINHRGEIVIPIVYHSIQIDDEKFPNMAFVEYEKGKKGFIQFGYYTYDHFLSEGKFVEGKSFF